jgi:hypothetical protein
MGYIFAAIILMLGLLLNLLIILSFSEENRNILIIVEPLIILLSYFVCRLVNSKLNKDLSAGVKTIITETVQKKRREDRANREVEYFIFPYLAIFSQNYGGRK